MSEPLHLFLSQHRVSAFDRTLARALDFLVAGALFSLGFAVSYAVAVILACLYLLFQDAWGSGVGKRLLGLRLVQEGSGQSATWAQGVLRNVPFAVGLLLAAIPAFWVFFLLVFVPWLVLETFFVWRLESGRRLGDVLAYVHVDDSLRRPTPRM